MNVFINRLVGAWYVLTGKAKPMVWGDTGSNWGPGGGKDYGWVDITSHKKA